MELSSFSFALPNSASALTAEVGLPTALPTAAQAAQEGGDWLPPRGVEAPLRMLARGWRDAGAMVAAVAWARSGISAAWVGIEAGVCWRLPGHIFTRLAPIWRRLGAPPGQTLADAGIMVERANQPSGASWRTPGVMLADAGGFFRMLATGWRRSGGRRLGSPSGLCWCSFWSLAGGSRSDAGHLLALAGGSRCFPGAPGGVSRSLPVFSDICWPGKSA